MLWDMGTEKISLFLEITIDVTENILIFLGYTVMILSFRTDRTGQTVQTQIRLLLEEQSDQCLHCLLFSLHLFYEIQIP